MYFDKFIAFYKAKRLFHSENTQIPLIKKKQAIYQENRKW